MLRLFFGLSQEVLARIVGLLVQLTTEWGRGGGGRFGLNNRNHYMTSYIDNMKPLVVQSPI